MWMGGDGFYKTAGRSGSGLDERLVWEGRGAVGGRHGSALAQDTQPPHPLAATQARAAT